MYRRAAGRFEPYDFSIEALIACHEYESNGGQEPKNNGYLIGKKWLDLSIETWRQDIMKGDSCKAEFITPITRWYVEPAMKDWIVPTWFPFENKAEIKNIILSRLINNG